MARDRKRSSDPPLAGARARHEPGKIAVTWPRPSRRGTSMRFSFPGASGAPRMGLWWTRSTSRTPYSTRLLRVSLLEACGARPMGLWWRRRTSPPVQHGRCFQARWPHGARRMLRTHRSFLGCDDGKADRRSVATPASCHGGGVRTGRAICPRRRARSSHPAHRSIHGPGRRRGSPTPGACAAVEVRAR